MSTELFRRPLAGYAAALAGVAAATAVCAPFHDSLNTTTVALAYLLVVLLVATTWGSRPALVASVLAVSCFNFFFLPPVYTFTIADPQNWVALVAFFITAVTAGQLSELAKRRAAEAEAVRTSARLAAIHSRSLLEASPDALVTLGTDGRINDANSAIETMTGISRSALVGADFSGLFTVPEQARAVHEETVREGFVRDRPLELRHRDGHTTSILYSASIQRDDAGTPIGVVVAARPVASAAAAGYAVPASNPVVVRFVHGYVACASVAAIAVGAAGVAGWTFGVGILKSVVPGQVIIKPNAAIALVLCGCALWLLRDDAAPAGARRLGRVMAAAVAGLGLATLWEHLAGWDIHIDQLFFVDQNPWEAFGSIRPGLIAPITAIDFALIGVGLLTLDSAVTYRGRRYRPAQLLAFGANTGAIVGLLDFVLGSHTSYTHIAPQTAVTLFLLSVAVAIARTDSGLGALVVSTGYGGELTRTLWPATVAVPVLLGAAAWRAHVDASWSEWSAVTSMIVAMTTLLAGLTVWSGGRIDRGDVERRRAEASLHRREEELKEAQRLARVGSWWWNPATDTVTWSEGLYRIVNVDPKVPPPRFREHARFYTPESFEQLAGAVDLALRTGAPFELELEMICGDGTSRSVTSRGEAERDGAGRVVLIRGSIHDVTEHKQAEDALRASEANLTKAQAIAHIGSWHLDVARDRLTWSHEVFHLFGIPEGTPLTYESFLASIHPDDRTAVDRAWSAAMRGAPYDVEHRIVIGDTVKWVRERAEVEFDRNGRPLRGVGTVQDVTERKRAQEELLRLNRSLRALSRCNEALIRATDESAWLDKVCHIVVDEAGYRFCWVGRAEDDAAKSVTAVAEAGVDEGYLQAVNISWADDDRSATGTCIRAGRLQNVANTAQDPARAPWRAEALKRGYGSMIAIPLTVDEARFGALSIYASEADAFRDPQVELLSELAADLGFGVTTLRARAEQLRAEREVLELNADLERRVTARTADLEAARERQAQVGFRIQQMLLLTQPPTDVPGIHVAALTIPSQKVDGDFYDFFRHEHDCLDVIVADVMGKGIPAALLAAATKSNFLEALCHLMAMSHSGEMPQPKEIVTLAHADMVRQLIDLESFVTASYARFDLANRHVLLVDCGHTGMMILRGHADACDILHGDNLPLGLREGEVFEQITVPFQAGDLFLFYSDGVTDVRGPAGEHYGVERLSECVRRHRDLEPRALLERIRQEAVAFGGTERFADDLTCVAMRIVETPRLLKHAELEIRSTLQDLRRVRSFVRECCRSAPGGRMHDEDVAGLELAVNEAASNVIKHACHGRADRSIQIDADIFEDRVSIRLHHLGDSFDPKATPMPAFDGSRESGFGMFLMAHSVDEVQYSRDERGRNCIALVKIRKP